MQHTHTHTHTNTYANICPYVHKCVPQLRKPQQFPPSLQPIGKRTNCVIRYKISEINKMRERRI